jgi:hypothetical protein
MINKSNTDMPERIYIDGGYRVKGVLQAFAEPVDTADGSAPSIEYFRHDSHELIRLRRIENVVIELRPVMHRSCTHNTDVEPPECLTCKLLRELYLLLSAQSKVVGECTHVWNKIPMSSDLVDEVCYKCGSTR